MAGTLVVGLFSSLPMANDGLVTAQRTQPWQHPRRERGHPGSILSSATGSAIKRITGGEGLPLTVSAKVRSCGPGLHPPVKSVPNEKEYCLRSSMMHLQVNGPNPQALHRGDPIEPSDIHEHRLGVTDEELLGVSQNATAAEIKRARRESAKLYHVDKHQQLEPGLQHVLTPRMKEQNAAADRVLSRLRRAGEA